MSGEQPKRPTVIQQSHNPRADVDKALPYRVAAAAAGQNQLDADSTLLAPPSDRQQQQQHKGQHSPALLVDFSTSPGSLRRGLTSDNVPPSGSRLTRRTRFLLRHWIKPENLILNVAILYG